MSDELLLEGSDSLLLEGTDALVIESLVSAPSSLIYTPGQHATDFREYPRGRLPRDMTERWATGSTSRVEGALYDLPGRNTLQLTGGNGVNRFLVTWNAIDGDTNRGNQEMLTLLRPVSVNPSDPMAARPTIRAGGTLGAENGYRLLLGINSTLAIGKLSGGTPSTLDSASHPFVLGGWYWVRFGATGTTIRARVWADGDAEPVAWTLSTTDASFPDGYLGFHLVHAAARYDVKYLGVGTDGLSAPQMSSLPRTLEEWSSDPSADLETTLEFERADPSGVISWVCYTNKGPRHTGPGDFPPNVDFEPVVLSAGGWSQQLSADALFAAQVIGSMQGLQLRNEPRSPKGPGPLDDWDGYTFAGRPMTIRMGETRQMHRRFEIVFSPSVVGEPDLGTIGSDDKSVVEVSLGTRLRDGRSRGAPRGRIADQQLDVRRYVGIPTGVYMMTSSGSGQAASIPAYDLRSFIVAGRFKTTGLNNGAGSGAGILAARSVSTTDRQFRVNLLWLGHATPSRIEVLVSIAGTATSLGVTAARFDDGFDHWWGLGILDATRFYLLVDGEVHLSGAMSGSVDLPASPIAWGLTAKDGLFWDTRFGEWMDEDQLRSSMSGRLLSPLGLNWVGYWPGDDASGSTATDYSVQANHAALGPVLNTDFRWDPTDNGMPGQTGRPMPLSLGVLFNAKAEQHDALRGRFRINDGALPAGTAATIKARGLVISSGPDYTQPAPGVVDMVTAQSEPVTYDLNASATPESEAIHVPQMIGDALAARAGATHAEADFDSFSALRKLLPLRGGVAYSQPPTTEALLDLLGPLGAHHFIERYGRIAAGYLAPPLNPGPYGQEGLLEFTGTPHRGVTVSAHSSYSLQASSTWGLMAWVWFPRLSIDASLSSSFTHFPAGMTIIDRYNSAGSGFYLGIDGRDHSIVFGSPGVTGTVTGKHYLSFRYPFLPHRWYLIFGAQDSNTRTIGVGLPGAGVIMDDTSELTTGTMTDPTNIPLRIGHGSLGSFYGGIAYAIGSSDALTTGAASSVTLTRPASPLPVPPFFLVESNYPKFLLPLTDGDGNEALEVVQGRIGRIDGARWCPRQVLDFTFHAEPRFGGSHRLRPAWRVIEKFRRNSSPVTGADVSSSVSGADRVAIETAYLEAPVQDTGLRDVYLDAREIPLDSVLADQLHASAVGQEIRSRFSPERRVGDARGWRRDGLRLNLTDEVLLKNHRYGLSAGVPCRVASLAPTLAELQASLDISTWR